jgi:hypothetical protein
MVHCCVTQVTLDSAVISSLMSLASTGSSPLTTADARDTTGAVPSTGGDRSHPPSVLIDDAAGGDTHKYHCRPSTHSSPPDPSVITVINGRNCYLRCLHLSDHADTPLPLHPDLSSEQVPHLPERLVEVLVNVLRRNYYTVTLSILSFLDIARHCGCLSDPSYTSSRDNIFDKVCLPTHSFFSIWGREYVVCLGGIRLGCERQRGEVLI